LSSESVSFLLAAVPGNEIEIKLHPQREPPPDSAGSQESDLLIAFDETSGAEKKWTVLANCRDGVIGRNSVMQTSLIVTELLTHKDFHLAGELQSLS
jgi:hypothetical protein